MKMSKLEQGENQHNFLVEKLSGAKAIPHVPDNAGVPIDRGWAWMTVLGCFGMHVTVMGCLKSLGVLLVEVQDRFQGVSARDLGLVLGLSITLMMGLGLLANLLAARFTCRAVVFLGGLLSFAGFVMTAFVNRFWMIYLTCSLTCGVGFALSYSPCIVFVGSHFKERRSLANGLALSGSGIGTFLLPNLIRWLINVYGLPGCCMIVGALMLNICACALLFRPHSNYQSKSWTIQGKREYISIKNTNVKAAAPEDIEADGNQMEVTQEHFDIILANGDQKIAHHSICKMCENLCNSKQNIKETESCVVSQICKHNCLQQLNLANKDEYENELLKPFTDDASKFCSQDLALECNISHPGSFKNQKSDKSIFDRTLLSNPVLIIYIAYGFLVNFGYPNVFFMLPAHAENKGQSRNNAALLVSIVGITDLLGRIFVGWFADLKLCDRRYILVGFTLASGILYILLPLMTSFWGIAAFAIMYGFCGGSYITLIAVVLADTLGKDNLGSSYGLTALAMALSLIPGSFLCGQIRDSTGSWTYAFISVGSLVVIGALSPLLQPLVLKCHHRRLAHVTNKSALEMTEL